MFDEVEEIYLTVNSKDELYLEARKMAETVARFVLDDEDKAKIVAILEKHEVI